MKPIVAVVGRPNVGKSTLVNRLAQTSDAIVHESRGVTRDRSYHTADWNGREFTIVDTGGIEPLKSDDVFATSIRDQALAAAEEAAVILFVVDGRTGVTEEDESVARMLKRCDKPVFLLANKLDNPDRENDSIWEFYSLGIGEPTPLSALHGHGTGDLLDDIVALLPEEEDEVADEFPDALNVAIIGRPNAGKSSLFNRILGADRSIVSNIAGTTRDAIDTVVERNGKHYRMVDTAGIRKKSTVYENIEYYSMVRGLRAIDRADVALLVVDASVGVTEQDQKVMGLAIERGCASIEPRPGRAKTCSTTTASARPAWRPSTAVWALWLPGPSTCASLPSLAAASRRSGRWSTPPRRRARKRSPPRASTPSSPTCASSVIPWWTASAACACTT